MNKEQALKAVEKAIDLAYENGKQSRNSATKFLSSEECEQEAIRFTDSQMNIAGGLLSKDYKTGYKEGIEHYLLELNKPTQE